jgi:hypothetical protein
MLTLFQKWQQSHVFGKVKEFQNYVLKGNIENLNFLVNMCKQTSLLAKICPYLSFTSTGIQINHRQLCMFLVNDLENTDKIDRNITSKYHLQCTFSLC